MEKVDIAVIGAGLVGLMIASELADSDKTVVLLEKNDGFGKETSSRNSEVIHSGVHYKPGSLKAKLCVEGNDLLYKICKDNNIPHKRIEKLTVGTDIRELTYLKKLYKQGIENGVQGLKIIDKEEIAKIEPNVSAEYALWSATTGIIDSHELMASTFREFKGRDGMFLPNSEVAAIERTNGGYSLSFATESNPFIAEKVINSAGLHADRIASMIGIDVDKEGYRLRYCKGEYFGIRRPLPIQRLIYGVPHDTLGLGVHLVINMAGAMRLGPNAFYVDALQYDVDPRHKSEFYDSTRGLFSDVSADDLIPDTSGIRPKLAKQSEFTDFIIKEESAKGYPGFVNLIGIESPGLTASPAIARYVKRLLQ